MIDLTLVTVSFLMLYEQYDWLLWPVLEMCLLFVYPNSLQLYISLAITSYKNDISECINKVCKGEMVGHTGKMVLQQVLLSLSK